MERNTVLAFVLSAAVLFVYQAVFVPPKQISSINNSQIFVNKVVTKESSFLTKTSSNGNIETTNILEKPINFQISNPNNTIFYTNVGGSLHKVDFSTDSLFPVTNVLSIKGFENSLYTGEKID